MADFKVELPEGTFKVEGVDTPEQAYLAVRDKLDTDTLTGANKPETEDERSFGDQIGIGVDQAQSDMYGLIGRFGDAIGSESIKSYSEEGIKQQERDMYEQGHMPGDSTTGLTDFTRGAGGTVAGLAAVPVAMAGGVPAAVAGGALGATSVLLNTAEQAGRNPEKSIGDLGLDIATDAVIDIGLGGAGKAVGALGKGYAATSPVAQGAKAVNQLRKTRIGMTETLKEIGTDRKALVKRYNKLHADGEFDQYIKDLADVGDTKSTTEQVILEGLKQNAKKKGMNPTKLPTNSFDKLMFENASAKAQEAVVKSIKANPIKNAVKAGVMANMMF